MTYVIELYIYVRRLYIENFKSFYIDVIFKKVTINNQKANDVRVIKV